MAKLPKNKEVLEHMEGDEDNNISFVPPPSSRLIVKRADRSITRQIPKQNTLFIWWTALCVLNTNYVCSPCKRNS